MTIHRAHRAPDTASGSWLAWGATLLVVAWAVWWILPRSVVEPASVEVQVVLPLVVHLAAAAGVGCGMWRRTVPSVPGQLSLLVLGAAVTMESVALLLMLFPPSS